MLVGVVSTSPAPASSNRRGLVPQRCSRPWPPRPRPAAAPASSGGLVRRDRSGLVQPSRSRTTASSSYPWPHPPRLPRSRPPWPRPTVAGLDPPLSRWPRPLRLPALYRRGPPPSRSPSHLPSQQRCRTRLHGWLITLQGWTDDCAGKTRSHCESPRLFKSPRKPPRSCRQRGAARAIVSIMIDRL